MLFFFHLSQRFLLMFHKHILKPFTLVELHWYNEVLFGMKPQVTSGGQGAFIEAKGDIFPSAYLLAHF